MFLSSPAKLNIALVRSYVPSATFPTLFSSVSTFQSRWKRATICDNIEPSTENKLFDPAEPNHVHPLKDIFLTLDGKKNSSISSSGCQRSPLIFTNCSSNTVAMTLSSQAVSPTDRTDLLQPANRNYSKPANIFATSNSRHVH